MPQSQRQSTVDCRYLALFCDNVQENVRPKHFGNSTIPQPNKCFRAGKIRLLGQKKILKDFIDYLTARKSYFTDI
jgi:hypothetical protein